MKKALWIIAIVALLFSACDDNTLQLGYSIVPNVDDVIVGGDTFTVASRTVVADSVVAENGYGYLGRMRDVESNAYVTADFLSQFNVIEGMEFDNPDSIVGRDENGNMVCDDSSIYLYIDDWYGDSLNQMQLTCYELDKPLEENRVYYSNFDVENSGYIRPTSQGGIKKTVNWSICDMSVSDTIRAEQYGKRILIPLKEEYKAKNGKTYKNFASYIFSSMFEHPEYFKNAYTFNHNVCPGFYFKTTNSIGTMAEIILSEIPLMYEFRHGPDSISYRYVSLCGTQEVLQLSKVQNDSKALAKLIDDKTCTYIKSPAGLFTELTLPIEEIFAGHERDSINIAELTLQRINSETTDKNTLKAPTTLLLVEKDSLRNYFELGNVSDDERSYVSVDKGNSNAYSFPNVSGLITTLFKDKVKGEASDPNWKAKHPNWNKVLVMPVIVATNSTGVVTAVCHDMSMKSVRLVGGDANGRQPLTMKIVYSKFNSNN